MQTAKAPLELRARVSRWIRDCGCHTGGDAGGIRRARATPHALNFLADQAAHEFEQVGSDLLGDVWEARNAYIQLILDKDKARAEFFSRHQERGLSPHEEIKALTLLEMQRCALLMFTSCGWFFSDISGIEPIQVLKYACRVIERWISWHALTAPTVSGDYGRGKEQPA